MIVNELDYSILIELENNLISKNKPDCKINSLDNKINFSRGAIIYFYLGQTVIIHGPLTIWNALMLARFDSIQKWLWRFLRTTCDFEFVGNFKINQLHRCWWPVSNTAAISDNFEILVTDLIYKVITNIYILSSNSCHQHQSCKANIEQPLKDHPGFGDEIYIKRRKMFNNLVANNKVFQV